MEYSVIVLAAGCGSRTGLKYNKMFFKIADSTVIEKSINNFDDDKDCKEIILVVNEKEIDDFKQIFKTNSKIKYAIGGSERQYSVNNGLALVTNDYVLIHDGARCFVSKKEIDDLKKTLIQEDAALLMVDVVDTIKKVINGYVETTYKRSEFKAALTPQGFKTSIIKKAHKLALDENYLGTDDASLVEYYNLCKVKAVAGSYNNIKITTEADVKKLSK